MSNYTETPVAVSEVPAAALAAVLRQAVKDVNAMIENNRKYVEEYRRDPIPHDPFPPELYQYAGPAHAGSFVVVSVLRTDGCDYNGRIVPGTYCWQVTVHLRPDLRDSCFRPAVKPIIHALYGVDGNGNVSCWAN